MVVGATERSERLSSTFVVLNVGSRLGNPPLVFGGEVKQAIRALASVLAVSSALACGLIAESRDLRYEAAAPTSSERIEPPAGSFDAEADDALVADVAESADSAATVDPCSGAAFCDTFESNGLPQWDYVSGRLLFGPPSRSGASALSFSLSATEAGGFADKRLPVASGSFRLQGDVNIALDDLDGGGDPLGQTLTAVLRPAAGPESFVGIRHLKNRSSFWMATKAASSSTYTIDAHDIVVPARTWVHVDVGVQAAGGVVSFRCKLDGVLAASLSYFGPPPASALVKVGHDIPDRLPGTYRVDNVRFDSP